MSNLPQPFIYHTPWGDITLMFKNIVCHAVLLEANAAPICPAQHPVAQWLDNYFSGHEHMALPRMAIARTPFQHRLRHALLEIPEGRTLTYGALAKALHSAPRAVGQALGANPLPILIPCHRIIAAHGLGGFSCGLEWKQHLLTFERSLSCKRQIISANKDVRYAT